MSRQLNPAVNSNDHIQGNDKARIELVEYGDYQCPHCGRAYPMIKNIQRKMGGDLRFVFRNFPISEIHPDAFNSAVATEAAGLQHKFWEMHDIIFENQQELGMKELFIYAKTIGLDLERFKSDIQMEALANKVEADFESGALSGVNGTPTFFINKKRYDADWEEHTLMQYLKGQLPGVHNR